MPDQRRVAVVAGLLAGATAVLVLSVGRLILGPPGFLDTISDGVTLFLPLNVFETILGTFGPYAKGLAFAGVAVGAVLAGGIAGLGFARIASARLSDGIFVSAIVFFLAEFVALPIAGAGFFGSDRGSPIELQGPLLLASVAYGFVFIGIRAGAAAEAAAALAASGASGEAGGSIEAAGFTRRRFLGRTLTLVGAGALIGAGGSVILQVLVGARHPAGGAPTTQLTAFGPTPALTPVDDFYRVDKNLIPPAVDADTWRLALDGMVDHPQLYTIDDLRGKPHQEAYRTLECISYQVVPGDDLISNQRWAGVRLSDLLDEAGVQAGAGFLLLSSVDGYTESMPLEVARHPMTWVADEMGPPGTPLQQAHGFPARVLIAGRFGMKQPKWLNHIEVAAADVDGYWEQRGWDKQAIVVTMSRIDWPRNHDEVPIGKPFMVYGIANAGDRGISKVELSADDGQTWQKAELEPIATPLGPLTWVRWRVAVTVAAEGTVRLAARATDGQGKVQDGTERPPLPGGATGWHRVRVDASPNAQAWVDLASTGAPHFRAPLPASAYRLPYPRDIAR